MWPFKGGDGWGFFNSSNLKFQLIFNSGQPVFKVEFSIEFSTQINPYLNVRFKGGDGWNFFQLIQFGFQPSFQLRPAHV